jgi:hypothetical protein
MLTATSWPMDSFRYCCVGLARRAFTPNSYPVFPHRCPPYSPTKPTRVALLEQILVEEFLSSE